MLVLADAALALPATNRVLPRLQPPPLLIGQIRACVHDFHDFFDTKARVHRLHPLEGAAEVLDARLRALRVQVDSKELKRLFRGAFAAGVVVFVVTAFAVLNDRLALVFPLEL